MVEDIKFLFNIKRKLLKAKKRNFHSTKQNNFFIVYELDTWSRDLNNDFTLKHCLCGCDYLAKNTNSDKYVLSGSGIRFNSRLLLSIPNFDWGKNAIIFGVDMSLSIMYIDNKKKDILIHGKRTNTSIRRY